MARDRGGAELERLPAERGSAPLAAATALAGSRQDGEDLLQAALERVLRKPRRLNHDSDGKSDVRATCAGSSTTWPPTAGGGAGPGSRSCCPCCEPSR